MPVEPHVKSAETRELFNNDVSGFLNPAKSADPTCYNSLTVELTGLFDMESKMKALHKVGDVVTIFQMSATKGLLIEGKAVIRKVRDDAEEYYDVEFVSEPGQTYERFVDRQGQEQDPKQYVKEFNKRIGLAA